MNSITIGTSVKILSNQLNGKVEGIWQHEYGVKYDVKYSDANGTIHNVWLRPDEFEVVN